MTGDLERNFDEISYPRYKKVSDKKNTGATYTPDDFSNFLANKMVESANLPEKGKIRILDPAVGSGDLLVALINLIPKKEHKRLEVFGYDTDKRAVITASERLKGAYPKINIHIEEKDFLEYVINLKDHGDLFSLDEVQNPFHMVIANPPYVRTQIMGEKKSQEIAKSFGLSGRVDLYYPFLIGISYVLAEGGITGIITSNRFMTTKSGKSIRKSLLNNFNILHAWDLGDTKPFEAAVLPSVLLAEGLKEPLSNEKIDTRLINFSSIYETKEAPCYQSENIFSALDYGNDSISGIPDGRCFHVRHGKLNNGGNIEEVWRIATESSDKWLATVGRNTWGTFGEIGKIRVGVKSTADTIFIRNDWSEIPEGRPELLRPLITRHCARQYKACAPKKEKYANKEILYPHEMTSSGRRAVDIELYPIAHNYLNNHKKRLESRSYLINAGRNWYELWVPQDPSAWRLPKLVFVDISDKPNFWIDTDGGVVNGECYWLKCDEGVDEDLLWLALAVANSEFIEQFYDHRFNNKLYAGRRRFITQYVEKFPLPDPSLRESKEIVRIVKNIYEKIPSEEADNLSVGLDHLVFKAFGLS